MAELALTSYHWPGNVRELERMMERAVALATGEVIELDDLPARVRGDYAEVLAPSLGPRETLRLWAGRYVRLILNRCEGNKRRASRTLGISYHTLNGYLQEVSESEGHGSDAASGQDAGRESGPAGLPASAGS